jgi:hypothetical protein
MSTSAQLPLRVGLMMWNGADPANANTGGSNQRKVGAVTNSKLQAALDELERLNETVRGFKQRNGRPPNTDSDAGRAFALINDFLAALHRLSLTSLKA